MESENFGSILRRNVKYAYTAQIVTMFSSFLFVIILPKFLGVAGFGYWQLMILYVNYLGVFYLGLNDGIYIKMGGKSIEFLDKSILWAQVSLFFIIHSLFSGAMVLITFRSNLDLNHKSLIMIVLIYLPFFNLRGILDQVLQSVNLMKYHLLTTVIEKILVTIIVVILITAGVDDYFYFLSAYILVGIFISLLIFFISFILMNPSSIKYKNILHEMNDNIKKGFPIMLSSLVSLLILGLAKQSIEIYWGIEEFGKIALSLSIISLLLIFVNRSGVALFPSLKKLNSTDLVKWYGSLKNILEIILPLLLFASIPASFFINTWLKDFNESLLYFNILLPIVIFEGKMGLIGTTFFKLLGLERKLLVVNIISVLVIVMTIFTGVYVFYSLEVIVVGIVVSLFIRQLLAEIILRNKLDIKHLRYDYTSTIITTFFIVFSFLDFVIIRVLLLSIVSIVFILRFKSLKLSYYELKDINQKKV